MAPKTSTNKPDNPKMANVISSPTKEAIVPANVGATSNEIPEYILEAMVCPLAFNSTGVALSTNVLLVIIISGKVIPCIKATTIISSGVCTIAYKIKRNTYINVPKINSLESPNFFNSHPPAKNKGNSINA